MPRTVRPSLDLPSNGSKDRHAEPFNGAPRPNHQHDRRARLCYAIVVKVRDAQIRNKPIYLVIGVTVNGEYVSLGLWAETVMRARRFWLQVLTELKTRGLQSSFTGVLLCTRTQSQAQPLQQEIAATNARPSGFPMRLMQDVPASPKKVRTIYRGEIVLNALPHKQVSRARRRPEGRLEFVGS